MSPTDALPYSRPLNLKICLGLPIAVAIILVLLELTPMDMDIAHWLYNPLKGDFIGRRNHFLENILHDRAKQAVIAFALLMAGAFIASFFVDRLKPIKRELGYVVLAMGISTGFMTPAKVVTSVQCPWSLTEFGGDQPYSELLAPRPATDKPGRCWPGGHAATGFSLFALFFALRDRRPALARKALVFAFTLGVIFSIGRMLQGAHFLSHNIWTAVICWLISLASYTAVLYRRAPKGAATPLTPTHDTPAS